MPTGDISMEQLPKLKVGGSNPLPPVVINLDRGWDIFGTWHDLVALSLDPFQSGLKLAHSDQDVDEYRFM